MNAFDQGQSAALKTAGLIKESINPMTVVKRMAARRPTKQLARHFDVPEYVADSPFGVIPDSMKDAFKPSNKAVGLDRLKGQGKLDQLRQQYNIPDSMRQAQPADSMVGKSIPEDQLPPLRGEPREGWTEATQQGMPSSPPDLRDKPLSPMLADNPMSTAMRKQYPKAPNMAAQMERTENALAASLGPERAAELPVHLREGIERTNYIPPSTENLLDTVVSPPETPGEAWNAFKGVVTPKGSGQINMGINDPAILAHEGRHAQQFLPAAGSSYRPGMMMGKPVPAVPQRNLAGKDPSDLRELLDVERDANLAVPGMVPDMSPEQMAMQAAAQGTYESMVNPALRKQMLGSAWDTLPSGAQAQDVIERLMRGEDPFEALQESGAADELMRYGQRAMNQGAWYDAPGTPKGLQERFRRANELRGNVGAREAEDVLSESGVAERMPEPMGEFEQKLMDKFTGGNFDTADEGLGYFDHPVKTMDRLSPMSDEITPFDKRFWRSAAMDPDAVSYQAKRHTDVTEQLREALGDDYANAYDTHVREQVGQADPEGLFAGALTPTQEQGKPSGFIDKIKGMFG